jgi:hypothetical protein
MFGAAIVALNLHRIMLENARLVEAEEAASKKVRRGWEPPVALCAPAPRHLSPLPDDAPVLCQAARSRFS